MQQIKTILFIASLSVIIVPCELLISILRQRIFINFYF